MPSEPQCDDSVIVPPKGCLDESLRLPTYRKPGEGRPCFTVEYPDVSLNVSDILDTIRNTIRLARRILFEIARLKRSIFAMGPLKLPQEASDVDKALMTMSMRLGTGYVALAQEDVNVKDLVLKGPTMQKAFCMNLLPFNML